MLFLIIPIFNEEQNIENLIYSIRSNLEDSEYKIIAINDGSHDNSLAILNKLASEKDDMIIESTYINMNVGAVFSTGLIKTVELASNDDDIAIIMEGDQTSRVKILPNLIQPIEEEDQDIVIASRYHQGGGFKNFPWLRRMYSQNASRLMNFFFHIDHNIRDYSIFFRSYRVGILKKSFKYFGKNGLVQSKGFVANAELLVKLSMLTNKITEIPFVYDYGRKKGRSHLRVARTIIEYFLVVSYLKDLQLKLNKYLQKQASEAGYEAVNAVSPISCD